MPAAPAGCPQVDARAVKLCYRRAFAPVSSRYSDTGRDVFTHLALGRLGEWSRRIRIQGPLPVGGCSRHDRCLTRYDRRAAPRAAWTAGNSRAIIKAIMAKTTSISISVKARRNGRSDDKVFIAHSRKTQAGEPVSRQSDYKCNRCVLLCQLSEQTWVGLEQRHVR
jgi:hypothetical protein